MRELVADPLRVLLAGAEAAALQTLRLLRETGQHVVGVLSGPAGPAAPERLPQVAAEWGYRVWPARHVRDPGFAEEIRAERTDLLLNVHSLHVVHAAVLAAPRIGSFNVHPGPLPEYAGLNAPSWAILHGEHTHGVTVHWMDAGIDTGHIAYEARFEVAPDETAFTLSARGVRAVLPLLRQLLEAAAHEPHTIPRHPQRTVPGRYYGREVPNGGRLEWTAPAQDIERFVRAADYGPFTSPWGGGPRTSLPGVGEVEVVKVARTGRRTDAAPGTIAGPVAGGALVACGDEWLVVSKLRVGGVLCAAAQLLESFGCFLL